MYLTTIQELENSVQRGTDKRMDLPPERLRGKAKSKSPIADMVISKIEEEPAHQPRGFAFLNVSNPSESLTAENRRKVRQHVRYGVADEVKAVRQSRQNLELRPAGHEEGDSPFINISHPSQIAAPQLVRFVRQQAQRKYRKVKPPKKSAKELSITGEKLEVKQFQSVVATPENRWDILGILGKETSPARLHVSNSSAIYPIKMDSEAHEIVAYLHGRSEVTLINETLLPIWFKLFIRDSAAFMEMLGRTLYYKGMFFGGANEKKVLTYKVIAIRSVHERLADPSQRYSIELVLAIVGFMLLDSAVGEVEKYKIHKSGLTRLIGLRGGIETLDHIEGLRIVLLWDDVANAYAFQIPPSFGIPKKHVPPLPAQCPIPPSATLITIFQNWARTNPRAELSPEDGEFLTIFRDFHILNALIQVRVKEHAKEYLDLGLQGNSVILQFMSPLADISVWSYGASVERACRLTALVYLSEVRLFFRFFVMPGYYVGDRFVGRLKDAILAEIPEWACFQELRLWGLVLGGIFSQDESDKVLFINATKRTMEVLNLNHWGQVSRVLEDIVWIDEIFGERCREFGRGVMATF